MNDDEIIRLYWHRDERAIAATGEKYGSYCAAIAGNILSNREDAEECVNDTYLAAWNSIPPHRPAVLSAFLGKITRNLALNRYKRNNAGKRGGGELPLVLDELADIVSGREDVEGELNRAELMKAIAAFLDSLPPRKRSIFVRRYWYADSAAKIADRCGMKTGAVLMSLNRMRRQLRGYLLERGFEL